MIGDWRHFEVAEHGVKALRADRELRRNGAGDSFDRRSEYRRWSAHRRIRSPPPSHRYHHSHPPPSSSSHHHLHTVDHIPTKPMTSILCNKQRPIYVSNPSPIHLYQHQPQSPSSHSRTHSHVPNQSQNHHTRETHKPQFHRFENTHENQFKTTKKHSRFSHHNSVTKYSPKPIDDYPIKDPREYNLTPKSLPKNQYTSLQDMMQFVTEWFDFEESEKASCDWSENKVVDCENRFHENLVNDHCDGKLEKENFNIESEFDVSDLNIDAWEIYNVLPGGSIVLSKNTGFKVFNKAHKWSTNQYVSMGHACSEYVLSDFVNENIENDVKLEEVKFGIDCMSTNLEKQGITDFEEKFDNSLSCEEIVQRNIMYNKGLVSEVDLVVKRNIPFGCVGKKNLQSELFVLVTEFDKGDTTIVKQKFKVEALFCIGLVNVLPPTCVQNLSGVELALDQWEQIIPFTRSKNFLLFFDHVSKNFVSGGWDVEDTNLRDVELYSDWVVKLKAMDDWLMSKQHQFLDGSTTRSSSVEPKSILQNPCKFYMESVFIWKVFLLDMWTFLVDCFEDVKVRLGLGDVDFVWDGFEVKKDLVGFISTLDPFRTYFVGKPPSSMIVDIDGFETKGTRQRQWWIAWTLLAFRWTIVLVPLWVWDALRRDFSVGVYHTHKPNRGLRSIVILLVHFPRVSTELEVEFFFKERVTDAGRFCIGLGQWAWASIKF